MDARVVRTRTALHSALFDLIQQRRWEKITVQDLLDHAGVSRSTFYAHYNNKLDVLTSEIPNLVEMIAIDPATSRLDLRALFAHTEEMAPVFAPLLAQPVLGEITAAIERSFADTFTQMVDADCSPALPRFLAGAMIATIRYYVTDRHRPPAAIISGEIEHYLNPLLVTDHKTPTPNA